MDTPYSFDFPKRNLIDGDDEGGSDFLFSPAGNPLAGSGKKPSWWKTCTVYQIWPASFKDGNDDGLGDIPGINSKLDYLHDLGVDVVWLSPMYASPQIDMGYDISDYNAIHPPYGTMADMDALIAGLHARGMRLILDLVINHTSSEHAWFQSSRRDRTNPHADWYIWRDPVISSTDGSRQPPNNWGANFGGSAWEYVPERRQYYLHLFAKEQPDLNWENRETRSAIYESALRFWFRKGVDGFRIDTANLYSKVQTFPDGVPVKGTRLYPYAEAGPYVANGPRIHEFYREMRAEVLKDFVGGDPLMVGELGGCDEKGILKYIGSDRGEISMVFDFDFAGVGMWKKNEKTGGSALLPIPWHKIQEEGAYTLPEVKSALAKTQRLVMDPRGWSSVFAENHDLPRSVARFGSAGSKSGAGKGGTKAWSQSAKLLALLLGTLSGTLYIYQGQEIGMTNIPGDTWSIKDIRDLNSLNYYDKVKAEYAGKKEQAEMLRKAWRGIVRFARDNSRTPVQWSYEKNAGFSSVKPWMRVNENFEDGVNVEEQTGDKDSVLSFWKRVIRLRRKYGELFMSGKYQVRDEEDESVFTFEKTDGKGRKGLVMLNISEKEQKFKVPKGVQGRAMRCVISNEERPGERLGPWEGRVYVEEEED